MFQASFLHDAFNLTDLMHGDVTHLEGSMGVVFMLKSKKVAGSATSGGTFDLFESSNKLQEPLLDGPAISEHMSALLLFKFVTMRLSTMLPWQHPGF